MEQLKQDNQIKEDIIKEVHKPDLTLFMACVPEPTKKMFVAWANKEFNGNYGFALKHLWDFYNGIMTDIGGFITAQMSEMNTRISIIEDKVKGDKDGE